MLPYVVRQLGHVLEYILWFPKRFRRELRDRDANAAQNIRVAGMHKMSEAGYVFVHRGEDLRLGVWSFLALLCSVQRSSMKRVGQTVKSSSEMAQFSN